VKVRKIKKFGKVIQNFCKEIGVDKITFFKALGVDVAPQNRHVAASIEDQSLMGISRLNSVNVGSVKNGFDTGKAALIAYTNLDQLASTEDMGDSWHKSPKTRNNFNQTAEANEIAMPSLSQAILARNLPMGEGSSRDLKESLRQISKQNKSGML
jgi:hypothetical protein